MPTEREQQVLQTLNELPHPVLVRFAKSRDLRLPNGRWLRAIRVTLKTGVFLSRDKRFYIKGKDGWSAKEISFEEVCQRISADELLKWLASLQRKFRERYAPNPLHHAS